MLDAGCYKSVTLQNARLPADEWKLAIVRGIVLGEIIVS
jgi:hypothetical protein